MFSVALLSLQDDQIDIVRAAVLHWCADHGHEVDSREGRAAMEMAISIALGGARDPAAFADYLEKSRSGAQARCKMIIVE